MLSASRSSVARDLRAFHEPATADWVVTCSDDEFVRLCDVADFLLTAGPTVASGASMIIAKACALAGVYIHESAPRNLSRARRDLTAVRQSGASDERRTNYMLQQSRPQWFAVGDDAITFWATDPALAKQTRARYAEVHHARASLPAAPLATSD